MTVELIQLIGIMAPHVCTVWTLNRQLKSR